MVEKSYVDKLVARNPLSFHLLITSPDYLTDEKLFFPDLSLTFLQLYLMTWGLTAVS